MIENIIGITGHQNIPEIAMPFLEKEIDTLLYKFKNVKCVTSLAIGADQLFTKKVLVRGGLLHAVIPCNNYEKTFNNLIDLMTYKDLLSKAIMIEKLNYPNPSEEAFYDAGRRVVEVSNLIVAIWDGAKAKGKGGTADIVKYAREKGKEIIILWPEGIKR